jgi:hypothetical protein
MMTDPNVPTESDILAARKLMKGWLPPSFAGDIDAGKLDGFGLYNRAMKEIIRAVKEGDGDE